MYTLNLSNDSINILYIEHLKKGTVRGKCIKLYSYLFLFRHWSLVATESREKAHEPGKIICVRSFGKVGRLLFARSVLSERRENRRMAAENMSERDPLSPAEEDNLLSEDNGSANPSQQGTDKVLANVLSAMTQMSSTMLSMETQ